MPGLRARASRRKQMMWLSLGVVATLIASEFFLPDLRSFWIKHPMSTSLAAFAASLLMTLLLVEELRQRREAKRWENVSHVAHRHLSGTSFAVCAGFLQATGFDNAADRLVDALEHMRKTGERPGREAPVLLPATYESDLAELLEDSGYRSALVDAMGPLTDELDSAMTQWSPIMLATPELAERLELFSMLRNSVIWVSGSIERYAESEHERTCSGPT